VRNLSVRAQSWTWPGERYKKSAKKKKNVEKKGEPPAVHQAAKDEKEFDHLPPKLKARGFHATKDRKDDVSSPWRILLAIAKKAKRVQGDG